MDLGFLGPGYSFVKDIFLWVKKRFQPPDPVAVLEIRRKWKEEFQTRLRRLERAPTYEDAIIRDISRMDSYPGLDEHSKGISPWFKVEIKGLYHRGLEVFLRVESVKYEASVDSWRWADCNESDVVNAYDVGRIPFEAIKQVEWGGDQYS